MEYSLNNKKVKIIWTCWSLLPWLIIINFCCHQDEESFTLKLYMPGNGSLHQGFGKWVTKVLFNLSSLKGLFPIKYHGIWTCTLRIDRAMWGHFMGTNSRKEERAILWIDKIKGWSIERGFNCKIEKNFKILPFKKLVDKLNNRVAIIEAWVCVLEKHFIDTVQVESVAMMR